MVSPNACTVRKWPDEIRKLGRGRLVNYMGLKGPAASHCTKPCTICSIEALSNNIPELLPRRSCQCNAEAAVNFDKDNP